MALAPANLSYILVRRMSEEDLGDMRDLWLELIADYGGHELEYDADAEEMWRGSMLASLGREDLGVLVAELRSDTAQMEEHVEPSPRVIGYVFFRVIKPPLRSKYADHVYVSDLVVRRNFRRMGVASALMRGLLKELGEGPHRIYLRVPADNDAAVRFYGKNGFRISEYVMEMELESRAKD
ncbi:MAG TPA: GNAT family N-acetyltransferase [Nitrososphaeria archaeon]|jgi:ribosomal protein S18 acetylase RimI-like enzyme|nr:MAG: hypothetical protein C0167_02355 [Nitrososphaera sp.]HEU16725.1 GNAT family N-acetyltransferase [Nitrososphaeria archaeon]